MSGDEAEKAIVEKYAEKKGMDKDQALKIMELLEEEKKGEGNAEPMLAKATMLAEILAKLGEASKSAPDTTQKAIGTVVAAAAAKTLLKDEDEGRKRSLEEELEDFSNRITLTKMKAMMLSNVFRDEDEATKKLLEEISTLKKELAEIKEAKKSQEVERLENLFKQLEQKVEERFTALAASPQPNNNGEEEKKPKSLDDLLREYMSITEEAKGWLERIGYRVEPDKLGKDEVERLLEEHKKKLLEELRSKPDELKAWLEEHGYKIQVPPRSWDDVERMVKEAEKRGYEMALDDKRIDAVQRVIERAVDNITNMFAPAIRQYWESVMSSRMGAQSAQSAAEAAGGGVASAAGNVRRGLQAASGSSS
jgi:L-rhamnose mutarotase